MSEHRVFLLGLDGATYDLFAPWARKGILPNLKRLMELGTWGDLNSTVPPTTPTAWSACLTGKNPGKHGIFDFRQSPLVDPSRPLISSQTIRGRKLWNLMEECDKKVGFLNVPITYPPLPVNGFMISGLMTPGEDVAFTWPGGLKDELLARFPQYKINLDIAQYDVAVERDALAFLRELSETFEQREQAMFWLLDSQPWDFLMAVFILPDRIQHLFWKYLDPAHPQYDSVMGQRLREPLLDCYRLMDGMLGRLVQRLEKDTTLFMMSDHGFGGTEAWFNVNRWLQDLGLVHLQSGQTWRKRFFYEAMQLDASPLFQKLLPAGLRSAVRSRIRSKRSAFKTDVEATVDMTTTKAFFASVPCQGIYINVKRDRAGRMPAFYGIGVVEPGNEYDELRAYIRKELYALRDPSTGAPVVDRVWYREEMYSGDQTPLAPDILFVARDYAYLGRQLFGSRTVIETSQHMGNGFHRMNGMFLAYGQDIQAGVHIQGADITDITPTVLYSMDLAIPDDMDGRVLTEIWPPERQLLQPIRTVSARDEKDVREPQSNDALEETDYTDSESAAVEARLQALGYMD
jgi:predicted AlkP superfamily phosphohydrolase/phosphomutase